MRAKTYKIITDRLLIRCYRPEDAPLLQKAIDESIDHLKPWMPWTIQEPERIEDKYHRLQQFKSEFDNGVDYAFGIFNKDETFLLGSTGLHTRIGPDAREIGYWIHADYLRKGFAIEAVSALIKVAFEIEGINQIEIHCTSDNIRSQGIPKRLGFLHELTINNTSPSEAGENRYDEMVWCLTKEAYAQSDLANTSIQAYNSTNQLIFPFPSPSS